MDYHTTTVKYRRSRMRYYASCDCGYVGEDRELKRNAEDDAQAHASSVNVPGGSAHPNE